MQTPTRSGWIHIVDRTVLFLRTKNRTTFFSPGGKIEDGESPEESLIREIKEEVGVDLKPDTLAHLETFSAQGYGEPVGAMVVNKCYQADYEGELAPQSEIAEMAWFTSADRERTTIIGKQILTWLHEHNYID